jgi:hypothetical protein
MLRGHTLFPLEYVFVVLKNDTSNMDFMPPDGYEFARKNDDPIVVDWNLFLRKKKRRVGSESFECKPSTGTGPS